MIVLVVVVALSVVAAVASVRVALNDGLRRQPVRTSSRADFTAL